MGTFCYSISGIHPFQCKGTGKIIQGKNQLAVICSDTKGTAAQNTEGFVIKVREWLKNNGHPDAASFDVFLYYPKDKSISGQEYFMAIDGDDNLGNPLNRENFKDLIGCSDDDLR